MQPCPALEQQLPCAPAAVASPRPAHRFPAGCDDLKARPAETMEGQADAAMVNLEPRVKANLVLGAESFVISSEPGILSEQLAVMKEKSMVILKEYITKHNAPNDVPDESVEGESDDQGDTLVKNPPKKSKKHK